MIDSIKKHEINHINDHNDGNTGFRLTYTDNFSMMKQIENNRADYMIISQNEFEYFEKTSSENKSKLSFKKLKDITTGNKRSLFCSKKVSQNEMDKINKSILKLVGVI